MGSRDMEWGILSPQDCAVTLLDIFDSANLACPSCFTESGHWYWAVEAQVSSWAEVHRPPMMQHNRRNVSSLLCINSHSSGRHELHLVLSYPGLESRWSGWHLYCSQNFSNSTRQERTGSDGLCWAQMQCCEVSSSRKTSELLILVLLKI